MPSRLYLLAEDWKWGMPEVRQQLEVLSGECVSLCEGAAWTVQPDSQFLMMAAAIPNGGILPL